MLFYTPITNQYLQVEHNQLENLEDPEIKTHDISSNY